MNKKIKIIVVSVLAIGIIIVGKFIFLDHFDPCPRCKKPGVPNTVSQTSKDYANLKIIYSKNNGSLPPPYHREYVYTISTDETKIIKGEYAIRDYDKVIEKRPLVISGDQLLKLIQTTAKINPESSDSVNLGCTGGSVKSVKVSQDKRVLLETSTYTCAGKATNESLEKLSLEIEQALSSSK